MANPYFNATAYLQNNPDVLAAGYTVDTAEQHYLQYGATEAFLGNGSRNPAPYFDVAYYLKNNVDLIDAGITPAEAFNHFINHGQYEMRSSSEGRTMTTEKLSAYAADNADLQAAFGITDPDNLTPEQRDALLNQYYQYGYNEGRPGDPFPQGETLTLTTGADTGPDFTGTDADDTFEAPLSRAGELPVSEQTLQGIDSLDGGEGNDTLNAQLNGFSGLVDAENPEIKNIEQYNLTVSKDGAHGDLDLARASGYEVLQNIGSDGDLTLDNVNLMDNGKAAEIRLTDVRGDTDINYDSDVASFTEQTVTADKVGRDGNSVDLSIDLESGGSIETLNLDVSNGVYLNLEDAGADIEHLAITGNGPLDLTGEDDFENLVTLDSTEHTGDLNADVSGSEVLESVETGAGNDRVVIHHSTANGDLVVDMGEGENILAIDSGSSPVFGATRLSNLKFADTDSDGKVENVQTLELANKAFLFNNASLDLTGFDENLSTVLFDGGLDGNANELKVISPNADLTLASNDSFEDVDLHTNGITNLTVNVTGGNLDIDQLSSKEPDVDGVAVDAKLETLTLTQTADPLVSSYSALDITSDPTHDVSNLQTITSTATGNASVEVKATSADADVGSLTSVSVTSTDGDATLNLTGRAGSAAVAGVRQVEQFVVNVGNSGTQAGNIVFTSGDLTGGVIATDYSENGGFFDPTRDDGSARDVANDLNASADLSASVPTFLGVPVDNTVTVEWADFGAKEQLNVFSAVATSGTISSPTPGFTTLITAGVTPKDMVAGDGFEALETATVVADDDAYVNLTDVYGALALDVTAGDEAGNNAYINLYNTEVTTVAAAAYHVDIDAAGNTVGNGSLTTITVSSTTADITLANNLTDFETLDVLNVSDWLVADTSGADFGSGNIITYLIGDTGNDTDAIIDVDFTGNLATREIYDFAGGNIGEVQINGFTWGADPTAGDRLDLSDFASSAGELVFSNEAGDLVITDLNDMGFGNFGGSITIVGAGAAANEFMTANVIYA
ncbi:hypothetical protein H0A65_03270 [Alcaligenaceae bacterium]|nr:hypothetical protein [Alcaligenaceae bacterium]